MPNNDGHSWNECQKKAEDLCEQLHKEGYTGQDLIFIGEQIATGGRFITTFEAVNAAVEAAREQIQNITKGK